MSKPLLSIEAHLNARIRTLETAFFQVREENAVHLRTRVALLKDVKRIKAENEEWRKMALDILVPSDPTMIDDDLRYAIRLAARCASTSKADKDREEKSPVR